MYPPLGTDHFTDIWGKVVFKRALGEPLLFAFAITFFCSSFGVSSFHCGVRFMSRAANVQERIRCSTGAFWEWHMQRR